MMHDNARCVYDAIKAAYPVLNERLAEGFRDSMLVHSQPCSSLLPESLADDACETSMPTCHCSDESVEVCDDAAGNDAAAISADSIYTSEMLMDLMRG